MVSAILLIALGFGLSMLKFAFSDFLFYSSIAPENPAVSEFPPDPEQPFQGTEGTIGRMYEIHQAG